MSDKPVESTYLSSWLYFVLCSAALSVNEKQGGDLPHKLFEKKNYSMTTHAQLPLTMASVLQ